jgi:hypothetical protein
VRSARRAEAVPSNAVRRGAAAGRSNNAARRQMTKGALAPRLALDADDRVTHNPPLERGGSRSQQYLLLDDLPRDRTVMRHDLAEGTQRTGTTPAVKSIRREACLTVSEAEADTEAGTRTAVAAAVEAPDTASP